MTGRILLSCGCGYECSLFISHTHWKFFSLQKKKKIIITNVFINCIMFRLINDINVNNPYIPQLNRFVTAGGQRSREKLSVGCCSLFFFC